MRKEKRKKISGEIGICSYEQRRCEFGNWEALLFTTCGKVERGRLLLSRHHGKEW